MKEIKIELSLDDIGNTKYKVKFNDAATAAVHEDWAQATVKLLGALLKDRMYNTKDHSPGLTMTGRAVVTY